MDPKMKTAVLDFIIHLYQQYEWLHQANFD